MTYDSSIRAVLESLAILDARLGPVELCCRWFDDLYLPAERHLERFHPDAWERGLREWQSCFIHDELAILAAFHAAFAAEIDTLSVDWPDWDQDPGWQRVRNAERIALAKLNG